MAPSQPVTPDANDGSAVLVTMNGKPLITKNMLESEKQKLFESNPQLQAMAGLMDSRQLDRNLVDGLASRAAIREYIEKVKVRESDEYRESFAALVQRLQDALDSQFFVKAFPVEVSDAEVKEFYEANKAMIPNLMLSSGGVESKGVSFTDEAAAKDFATKVRAGKNDLSKVAREENLASKVKDFKLVNAQSLGMDEELRDKITVIKKTPTVETFKVGKEYWVVAASRREEPKYRPLEQVSAELKQALEKEKTMKRFEEEVGRLKSEYQIVINEEQFAEKTPSELAVQTVENEEAESRALPETKAL